jgi:hypothetical protein
MEVNRMLNSPTAFGHEHQGVTSLCSRAEVSKRDKSLLRRSEFQANSKEKERRLLRSSGKNGISELLERDSVRQG